MTDSGKLAISSMTISTQTGITESIPQIENPKVIYDTFLRGIEFTYKRQAASFRGGIKNVCTVYSSNKKIIQLVPDEDAWSDDEIWSFVCGLVDSNVKKKFIGYGLKDVEM
jgi:hypothetical protein